MWWKSKYSKIRMSRMQLSKEQILKRQQSRKQIATMLSSSLDELAEAKNSKALMVRAQKAD